MPPRTKRPRVSKADASSHSQNPTNVSDLGPLSTRSHGLDGLLPMTEEQRLLNEFPKNKHDKAWKHVIYHPETVESKGHIVYCRFCGKKNHGGINRFKYHLACIGRRDVRPCNMVRDEVRVAAAIALEDHLKEKEVQKERTSGLGQRSVVARSYEPQPKAQNIDVDEDDRPIAGSSIRPLIRHGAASSSTHYRGSDISSYFSSTRQTGPGAQSSIEGMGCFTKDLHEAADNDIADFFYLNNIPFNASRSHTYQKMVDAIAAAGRGYKGPSYAHFRGSMLDRKKTDVEKIVTEKMRTWGKKQMGCSLMSDTWTDARRRVIMNFLLGCGDSTIFLKSVNVSRRLKNADMMFDLLFEVVREVGEKNIVQVITDNAAACANAGKKLMTEFPHITWVPCAAHCIDLLLEDIGKLPWIKHVVDKFHIVAKFLYGHSMVHALFLEKNNGKELRRPRQTRFASQFIGLQSMLECKAGIRTTFVCDEWTNDPEFIRHRISVEGAEAQDIVLELRECFWSLVQEAVHICVPLVRVLHLVDGELLAMGYLYEALNRAKEEIKTYYKGEEAKYGPIWKIIDERWEQLHRPIHAAAYFLNPLYCVTPGSTVGEDDEVRQGLMKTIDKLVDDFTIKSKIYVEVANYSNPTGPVGIAPDALASLHTMRPDQWWDTFGMPFPNLKKLARKVLVQPCSASACERNWSEFGHVQDRKRHNLTPQRL